MSCSWRASSATKQHPAELHPMRHQARAPADATSEAARVHVPGRWLVVGDRQPPPLCPGFATRRRLARAAEGRVGLARRGLARPPPQRTGPRSALPLSHPREGPRRQRRRDHASSPPAARTKTRAAGFNRSLINGTAGWVHAGPALAFLRRRGCPRRHMRFMWWFSGGAPDATDDLHDTDRDRQPVCFTVGGITTAGPCGEQPAG